MLIISKFLQRVRKHKKVSHSSFSSVHPSSFVDTLSSIGPYSVVFSQVKIIDSTVDAYSYVQEGSKLYRTDVGKFTSIAGNVSIGYPDHPMEFVSTSPVFYDKTQPLPYFFQSAIEPVDKGERTSIGNDTWIGQNSFVKAGLKIGTGSVIGAGSVVTKDIPPYSIAAGNPCRVIRSRFSQDITNALLDSKWWELNAEGLHKLTKYFFDPELFLKEFSKL